MRINDRFFMMDLIAWGTFSFSDWRCLAWAALGGSLGADLKTEKSQSQILSWICSYITKSFGKYFSPDIVHVIAGYPFYRWLLFVTFQVKKKLKQNSKPVLKKLNKYLL